MELCLESRTPRPPPPRQKKTFLGKPSLRHANRHKTALLLLTTHYLLLLTTYYLLLTTTCCLCDCCDFFVAFGQRALFLQLHFLSFLQWHVRFFIDFWNCIFWNLEISDLFQEYVEIRVGFVNMFVGIRIQDCMVIRMELCLESRTPRPPRQEKKKPS